jgi:hypothetical protein
MIRATWYGSPQLANETCGPRSKIVISAASDSRRARAAALAPPATPPTMTMRRWVGHRLPAQQPRDQGLRPRALTALLGRDVPEDLLHVRSTPPPARLSATAALHPLTHRRPLSTLSWTNLHPWSSPPTGGAWARLKWERRVSGGQEPEGPTRWPRPVPTESSSSPHRLLQYESQPKPRGFRNGPD